MKRIGTLMLGLALTAAGCVELPIRMDAKPRPTVEATATAPAPTALPPVAPEQVDEENAPKVLRSLQEELDRAANDQSRAR